MRPHFEKAKEPALSEVERADEAISARQIGFVFPQAHAALFSPNPFSEPRLAFICGPWKLGLFCTIMSPASLYPPTRPTPTSQDNAPRPRTRSPASGAREWNDGILEWCATCVTLVQLTFRLSSAPGRKPAADISLYPILDI